MAHELPVIALPTTSPLILPHVIARAGDKAAQRFVEFFLVSIRNKNTRSAYAQALKQFLAFCDDRGLELEEISSFAVAAYIEHHSGVVPTVKQHLTAIRVFFDWMMAGQILKENPAKEVRGPRMHVTQGKTPVLDNEEMRQLLESIDTSHVVGLRDRALITIMFYSFARISAVLAMQVGDYFPKGKRYWIRLHEKRGKYHELPVHHKAEEALDAYIEMAGIETEKKEPLFRTTLGRSRKLTNQRLQRTEAWNMIKRRAKDAEISTEACNHSFRASGITNYLHNGGSRDKAQKIAAHSDIRTTALYDRTGDTISLDEIERIRL